MSYDYLQFFYGFLMMQIIEKVLQFDKPTNMSFIETTNAFDVDHARDILKILKDKEQSMPLTSTIMHKIIENLPNN